MIQNFGGPAKLIEDIKSNMCFFCIYKHFKYHYTRDVYAKNIITSLISFIKSFKVNDCSVFFCSQASCMKYFV